MRINLGDKDNANDVIDETSEQNRFKKIQISENLDNEGTIKNLQNVIWNHAMINQEDNSLDLELYIRNESKTEVIPETELTINIKDKDGKTILTQNAQIEEIESNYGYAVVDLNFEIDDFIIVYDIEVIANNANQ